jgi:RNA polymerase sigma factor (sigma-70 family)
MPQVPANGGLDALLAQAEWLRELARYLAHDHPDAEDLVQETWAAALRSAPALGRPLRPWLAQVLRNLIRMNARGATRRRAREQSATAEMTTESASAQATLETLELQRMLAAMVKELDEPWRTTIVLRFFERREPAEIARAQGVPVGTVRSRTSEALRRLRQRLDEAHGGRREEWRYLLLPFGGPGDRKAPLATGRSGVSAKAVVLGAVAISAGIVGVALVMNRSPESDRPAPVTLNRLAPRTAVGIPTTQQQEDAMRMNNLKSAAVFLGLVLPAINASAEDAKVLTPEETVAFCAEMREKYLACKDVLADIRVSRVPAEKREGSRRMVLKEIVDDGTAPLEARKTKCATDLKDPKAAWISHLTRADMKAIRACQAEKECKQGVACWMNVVQPVVERSRKR